MIRYRAFTKRFGDHLAVDRLDFEVGAGEVVALLGPNGSGKTTSLKAAAGLVRPTSGDVGLGDPPRPASDPVARRACSFLPQKVTFPDSLSGREVVEFYRALRDVAPGRTDEVLKLALLNGAAARHVGTYSGGMVQRLGLAVATLADVAVLLLDEPTAALDPDGLCAFYGLVERRKRAGKTVLFTSHQLGDAERLADRLAVLIGGRLAACFTQRELAERLADRGVMRVRLASCPPGLVAAVRADRAGRRLGGRTGGPRRPRTCDGSAARARRRPGVRRRHSRADGRGRPPRHLLPGPRAGASMTLPASAWSSPWPSGAARVAALGVVVSVLSACSRQPARAGERGHEERPVRALPHDRCRREVRRPARRAGGGTEVLRRHRVPARVPRARSPPCRQARWPTSPTIARRSGCTPARRSTCSNPALETPMSSHIVAFATATSRDADPAAAGGATLDAAGVFGAVAVPGGGR